MRKLGKRRKLWLSRDTAPILRTVDYPSVQDWVDQGYDSAIWYDADDGRYCGNITTVVSDRYRFFEALIMRRFKPYRKRRRNP